MNYNNIMITMEIIAIIIFAVMALTGEKASSGSALAWVIIALMNQIELKNKDNGKL